MRTKVLWQAVGLVCLVVGCTTKDGRSGASAEGIRGNGDGAGLGGQGDGASGAGGVTTEDTSPGDGMTGEDTNAGGPGMTAWGPSANGGDMTGGPAGGGGPTGTGTDTGEDSHPSTGGDGMTAEDAGMIGPDSGADAGGDAMVSCTGKPGALRGKSRQTMMIGGTERWFNYYAPSTLDPNTPVPLVIVPHGYFMDADIMYEVTQYADLADEEQFVVAFPSGAGPSILDDPWNIGTPPPQCLATVGFLPMTENDDQAFVDAIINFVQEDQCLDSDHVFMAGFSMGGYFSNTTACNNDAVKAIAPHSAGSHDLAGCPATTKPVLLMHFEDDQLIPYACGTETRDRWLTLNGCDSADPEVRTVNGGSCEYYTGCKEGGQVAMCTFQTPPTGDELFVAHGWSGGYEPQPVVVSGYAIPETESATRLSWEFFTEFAW